MKPAKGVAAGPAGSNASIASVPLVEGRAGMALEHFAARRNRLASLKCGETNR